MARELKSVDITDLPDVQKVADLVCHVNEPMVLRQGGEDVAILHPMTRSRTRRIGRGKPFTLDDPLWSLVGAGSSGLGDVSQNKDKYLAEDHRPYRLEK